MSIAEKVELGQFARDPVEPVPPVKISSEHLCDNCLHGLTCAVVHAIQALRGTVVVGACEHQLPIAEAEIHEAPPSR